MTDDYPDPPQWPPDDPALEAAIGRLVIAWGTVERELDLAIKELYRLDGDLADSITANLGTKAKLEIFQSGSHCLAEFLEPVKITDIDELIKDTAAASAEHRNFVAHGQPTPVALVDPVYRWSWARTSARKGGPKIKLTWLTPDYFDSSTAEIRAINDRWRQLRTDMTFGLKLFDDYQRNEREES